MINGITEINFPQYATLDSATITLSDMGDRTIQTQVRIDGDVAPDFSGWELEFRGERFILPIREPQASKGNDSINSVSELTFYSWPIYQMKRYFFVETAQTEAGDVYVSKYEASVNMTISSFATYFQNCLDYYFNGGVYFDLNPDGQYSDQPVLFEISNSKIWDVLLKVYEIFNVRWRIQYNDLENRYEILVGYNTDALDITDHTFEYGYSGGLIRFERQVQDDTVENILLGRGGERNLPYRYFKRTDTDSRNADWAADPDALYELKDTYFDRLRDANFRWYVRGWMQNPNHDSTWENENPPYFYPEYDEDNIPEQFQYAYERGKTDTAFNPVEFVKDDSSIDKYGERWGMIEDNDDIYPTIQGIERPSGNRIDEVVAVGEIASDDIQEAAEQSIKSFDVKGYSTARQVSMTDGSFDVELECSSFTIETGQVGYFDGSIVKYAEVAPTLGIYNIRPGQSKNIFLTPEDKSVLSGLIRIDTDSGYTGIKFYNSYGDEVSFPLQPGTYTYKVFLRVSYTLSGVHYVHGNYINGVNIVCEVPGIKIKQKSPSDDGWKPTFDIWVKNIWNTSKNLGESDDEYSERVWKPILGDRVGNEAKVVFSTGFMSISEDYEFTIVSYPVRDTSQSRNGVSSEWKITLAKSDAEAETTGKFVPSADGGKPVAGDMFFFIGIDMPNQYVIWAEEDLTADKGAKLDKTKEISPTWVINFDKVRINTLEQEDGATALADRLHAGAKIKTKDKRFTNNTALELYVQSITYTWTNGTTLFPDIEVVLTDEVTPGQSTISQIEGDINLIRTSYVRTADIDSAIRRITNALYLKKNGEADTSYSPTVFAAKVSGEGFRAGDVGGSGWGIYQDEKGNYVIEADKLVARNELRASTFVANEVKHVGGKQISSAASITISNITEGENGEYRLYFDQNKGEIANLFVVGDIVLCQQFDPQNEENKYYRSVVTAVGSDYIEINSDSTAYYDGTESPEVGDVLVQYGHLSNAARQCVIINDVIDGGYIRMLSGLTFGADGYTSGDEYFFAGRKTGLNSGTPTLFVGDHNGEYVEFNQGNLSVRGKITILGEDNSEVLKPTSIISDGLVLSSLIGVIDSNLIIRAGINASSDYDDNDHGTLLLFAGSDGNTDTYIKNSEFRVYEDGTMFATKAILQVGCEIGNFRIENYCLVSGEEGDASQGIDKDFFKLFGSHIDFEYETLNITPGSTNYEKLNVLFGNYADYMTGLWYANKTEMQSDISGMVCFGSYYDIKGNNSGNYAIYAENGKYGGLRLDYDIIESDITLGQTKNVYYISGYYTITMPASPKEGQFYIFYIYNGATFIGNGKDFRTTDGRFLQNIGVSSGTHALVILTYTGVRWQACCVETQF